MKIAILGYGKQGESSFHYWQKENSITICDGDNNIIAPDGVSTRLGANHLKNLEDFDLIIRSPIVHPRDIIANNSPTIMRKVTTNTNEFFRISPTKNIIGVTGTKGKGTTSTLISKILTADNKINHLGGNIGIPPLELLKENIQPNDWAVLELANFQLIDLKYSPPYAVCLMVVPEHLDWQTDMAEYICTKQQLFRWQSSDNIAIYYYKNPNSIEIASISQAKKIPFGQAPGAYVKDHQITIDDQIICSLDDIKLPGTHNLQNICAAITCAWHITKNITAIRSAVTSFTSLPYRIELRKVIHSIRFYNDSFASGPAATLAALDSIPGPKVLILGGFDRMLDLNELIVGIIKHQHDLDNVLIIGASASRIATEMESHHYTKYKLLKAQDMLTIVKEAFSLASPNGSILLSPGFASFDMFKNFEDRGEKFNEAVEELAKL